LLFANAAKKSAFDVEQAFTLIPRGILLKIKPSLAIIALELAIILAAAVVTLCGPAILYFLNFLFMNLAS